MIGFKLADSGGGGEKCLDIVGRLVKEGMVELEEVRSYMEVDLEGIKGESCRGANVSSH